MGKRGRRRAREAGETPKEKVRHKLGQSGAFMVCRECGNPLTLFSLVNRKDEWEEEKIVYIHSLEYIERDGSVQQIVEGAYDHEAVPVESDPLSADTVCDFCYSPDPKYVFIPRRPIRMDDPLDSRKEQDFSSPWNVCEGCLPAVKSKSMTGMLNRAMESPYSSTSNQSYHTQQAVRRALNSLYGKYIRSNPSGPYELKLRDKPKPQGKPGSRRGM